MCCINHSSVYSIIIVTVLKSNKRFIQGVQGGFEPGSAKEKSAAALYVRPLLLIAVNV